jgi:uncharacterized glyoxalase superfamily protein PhnB
VIDFKELFGVIDNRSVPTNVLLPHIAYRDLAGAVKWLSKVFGFEEYYRYGNPESPAGVMIRRECACIMLKAVPANAAATSVLTVFVEDVDSHYEKAKSAGAKIVEELNQTCYGERQYAAEDLEGHRWLFSQHARDVDPTEWGAAVAQP